MLKLNKPPALRPGDKVAALSLSWGGAGDENLQWRYALGKRRLEELFGLEVVEFPTTLAGSAYVSAHPRERARDFMAAMADDTVKGIFSCIGGDDTLRLLPYIDFSLMAAHPKVFLGYSDTTVNHFMCLKAGFGSFYGPSILAEFAENVEVFPYTESWVRKALFQTTALGEIPPADEWTAQILPWTEGNAGTRKAMVPHPGYTLLCGGGTGEGPLIGGCIEVMDWLRGTPLWPEAHAFDGAVLFLEASEDAPPMELGYIRAWLRAWAAAGVLGRLSAMVWGLPHHPEEAPAMKADIVTVMRDELHLDIPVLFGLNFGHTEPMLTLPYGARARVDGDALTFTVLESGVK